MANCRPVSLLPGFSKVFEKAMYCRLNQHLQTNNILATEQYGFRKVCQLNMLLSHLQIIY